MYAGFFARSSPERRDPERFGTGTRSGCTARLMRSLTLVVASAGLLACESNSFAPVPVYEHHVTAEMVTGAALAALGNDGRFYVELPATHPGQLSLEEAKAQTRQFARYVTNNVLLRSGVEDGRGGYWIDPHLLTICEDAYYVHSHVGPITHDSLGEPGLSVLKRYGPRWLIPLCGSANEPQMTVQAAIDGNDVRFADGEPIEPYYFHLHRNAWGAAGVPLNWPHALSISAERAVRFAWETFGVRVAEVPELFTRGDVGTRADFLNEDRLPRLPVGSARSCHRWRIVLESDVEIRGMTSFTTVTTNVVYVAALTCNGMDVDPYIHLPLAEQPSATRLDYLDDSVSPARTGTVTIPFSSPVRFEIGVRVP